ncbi:FixH family protein [Parapedobacter sp. 10938]|uniref:FixH family protein n=1 Tax=Parapedobacter flavus TaxID=3110225 RepID=UPI002DB6FE09|nr:FixH family protein [Parapedobacter sp. 10938]MEC3881318.1 FixH family protein [Parapedobacter sp. 10938]
MSWGIKIVIALASFMVLIVSFGIYMVSTDTDTLVAEDYYERGLNYDRLHHIDSLQQSADSVERVLEQ